MALRVTNINMKHGIERDVLGEILCIFPSLFNSKRTFG